MRNVVILVHKYDSFVTLNYLLHEMAAIWREEGLHVEVLYGPGPHVDADLAILHVDLSVVPDDYLEFIRQYPVVINGSVTDILKRSYSKHLVRRGDGYQGKVIIKTNRNYGGRPESRLVYKGPLLPRKLHWFRNKLPWVYRSWLLPSDYHIFKSPSQVPRVVWHNPNLIVEQFCPERHDGFYCLRTWVFLGERESNRLSYSEEPIVKGGNIVRREIVPDVPDELRQMRQDMGFEFGKFDYGIVDGQVVLYDANRTPTVGNMTERLVPNIRMLAEGIHTFL